MIRSDYEELDVVNKQVGLDDDKAFQDEKHSIGEKLINKDYIPYLTQFAKRGVPSSLRGKIYSKVLDVTYTIKDYAYFAYLLDQS